MYMLAAMNNFPHFKLGRDHRAAIIIKFLPIAPKIKKDVRTRKARPTIFLYQKWLFFPTKMRFVAKNSIFYSKNSHC
jgi:hypothetical protein